MKTGIMQPYFFPYLGYWQLIAAVDKYVVYDDVAYIKGGWISRNNILLSGKSHMVTLPLVNPSSFRMINEIEVKDDPVAKGKILKTLEYAYAKAPFYDSVMPLVEDLINKNGTIAQMNYETVLAICDHLDINTEIILSSTIDKDNELKGEDKVIHIVKKLGGDTYINAIGGKELYSKDRFAENGLKLGFLKKDKIEYKQFKNEFIDNLSIIDVLMFNDKGEVRKLLDRYEIE